MLENIDFVECKACGFKGQTLNRHLAKHGMTAEEYHQKFPGVRIACESVMRQQGESLSRTWEQKPKIEKPKGQYICSHCGCKFTHSTNLQLHLKQEEKFANGTRGEDFIVCRECGMRGTNLSIHLVQHGLTSEQYLVKYPGELLTLPKLAQRRALAICGTHVIPIPQRAGAIHCDKCGEWYLLREAALHLRECVLGYPDKYIEGRDYVKCPECGQAFTRLGGHLKKEHGWDHDRIRIEANRGLCLVAEYVKEKWDAGQDFKVIQEKREQTHLERHGYKNPFSDPAVQGKIVETNQCRYGTDHPMQNEEVRIRQNESAMNGPSGQEVFFMEHVVSPNVVYVGFGGRFIRTKTGVRKYGRVIKDLNPDFMVLPDNVLESAISASKERRKLSSERHRTKYVIELLGDYYHSEKIIGVPPVEHEREVVDAYKSAGIECLTLWEHDVLGRWNEIEPMVSAWIQRAVADINSNPIWRKPTKSKVDGRLATLVCPFGSGKVFKSQAKLDKWVASPLNFWRPEMVEGKDYVRCLECPNVRVGKVAEHLRTMHGGMTKEQYLEKHPGALLVASRVSEMVARNNSGKAYIISSDDCERSGG